MKIGILTFHWATNYGAVLQAFALQKILQNWGHIVEIIDYKPSQYDNNLWNFLRYRKFLNYREYKHKCKKENNINQFRIKNLSLSPRTKISKALPEFDKNYDLIISGSDQILNPSFLQYGERGGSKAYFLDFSLKSNNISYGSSFGVTDYPSSLLDDVIPLVKRFRALSVRETTGINIFKNMGGINIHLVPDPTILLEAEYYVSFFTKLKPKGDYTFVYMLHGRLKKIQKYIRGNQELSDDESIEDWLMKIKSSKKVITNSYHGVIFSILFNIPFVVVLPNTSNIGMNDRFYTLLSRLGLTHRIVDENTFRGTEFLDDIDWELVNIKINEFRQEGLMYLNRALSLEKK